jgi:hypothetical protein
MSTWITHPTLAELWRILAARLERVVGPRDAPALARSLAIAGFTGQTARAFGVGVERRGDVVLVTGPEPSPLRAHPKGRFNGSLRPLAVHRRRMLATR